MSMMELSVAFSFAASHALPNVPKGHNCSPCHGHTFRLEVHMRGTVGEDSGWVRGFAEIKQSCHPLVRELDHHHLNDIGGLENPTGEHIARRFWERLKPELPGLTRIVVQEGPDCGVSYSGD